MTRDKHPYGPYVARVHREYVDGELARVLLEPFGPESTFELSGGDEFVTLMSAVPLAPLEAWPEREVD